MSTLSASDRLYATLDDRTRTILEQRRKIGIGRRRGWLVQRALLLSDVIGLSSAFLIAQEVYAARTHHVAGSLSRPIEFVAFALSLPLWIVAAKLYGLYDKDEERTDHSTTDDFAGLFHLVTVCTFLLYALAHETHWIKPQLSKLLLFWLLAVVLTATLRAVARAVCRRSVAYLQNTLIVGAGDVGQTIAKKLLKHPEYGINLVGFVDSNPKERGEDLGHLTVLGGPEELAFFITLFDIERVIYAFSNEPHEEALAAIRSLNDLSVQVDIVPRFFEVLSPGADVHTIEGVPVWGLAPNRLPTSAKLLKRALDLAGGVLGLILVSPLLLLLAVLIRVEAPGPIFFRQVRMGSGGRTFRIWKFRTMQNDADSRKEEFAHLNKHLLPGGDPRMFKIDNDPRVTRVGAVLRKHSLDELPQLINVIRGEMSLVGPRPLILDEHQHVEDWASRRLDLRPGITGLWQVLGRDEIPFEEMVKLDYLYVTSWTLWGDILLLFRTLPTILRSVKPLDADR